MLPDQLVTLPLLEHCCMDGGPLAILAHLSHSVTLLLENHPVFWKM